MKGVILPKEMIYQYFTKEEKNMSVFNLTVKYVISTIMVFFIGFMLLNYQDVTNENETNSEAISWSMEMEQKEKILNFYRQKIADDEYIKGSTFNNSQFYQVPLEENEEISLIYTKRNGKVFYKDSCLGNLHYDKNCVTEIVIWNNIEYSITYSNITKVMKVYRYGKLQDEKVVSGSFVMRTNVGYIFREDNTVFVYGIGFNGTFYIKDIELVSNARTIFGDVYLNNGIYVLIEMNNGELRAYTIGNKSYILIKDLTDGELLVNHNAGEQFALQR